MGSRAFCDTRTGEGGCSLGMHGSPPKRREMKARRSAAGRPSRRFGPPRRSWRTHSLCQEPSETGALSPSTLVRNAPLSVQNRTNLPDTPLSHVPKTRFTKNRPDHKRGALRLGMQAAAASRRAQQRAFESFCREYNEQRPHQALGQQVPASIYRPSDRAYPSRLPEIRGASPPSCGAKVG